MFSASCGGSEPNPLPTQPTVPPVQVDGGQLLTYGNAVAYLPTGVAEYKAAIVFLPGLRDPATGNDLDSRALVRGTSGGACSIWCSPAERAEVRSRALELAGGAVALVGTTTLVDDAASHDTLLRALSDFATQSLPSRAGERSHLLRRPLDGRVHRVRVQPRSRRPGRRLLHHEGRLPPPWPRGGSGRRPGTLPDRSDGRAVPERQHHGGLRSRPSRRAPWAVSIDAFQHGPIVDFDLMFDWIDAVLAARLPLAPGAPLRAVTATDGWLGDRSSGAISTYACFGAARSSASWLPSEETALDWQRMAGGTVVVSGC